MSKKWVVAGISLMLLMSGVDVAAAVDFPHFVQLGPSTLEQTNPAAVSYVEGTDYNVMEHSEPGDVTGAVTAVDIDLAPVNSTTSGCEASDFVGFPAGNIALIQRGTCFFKDKAENAADAGAVGVIVFNGGENENRKGLFGGTLQSDYAGGIPVFAATFDRGAEWAGTSGLVLHMIADVSRDPISHSEIVGIFDDFVAAGTLEGSGPGMSADKRLNALRNMLVEAVALIDADDIDGACDELDAAIGKVIGRQTFVDGDSRGELLSMLQELSGTLGCS